MGKELNLKTHPVPTPGKPWQNLRQQVDRVFDRFSEEFESFSLQPFMHMQNIWSPAVTGLTALAVDVSEGDKAYTITAELPGVPEKNVEVMVDDGFLVIKGEKSEDREEKTLNRYISERSYGAFQRAFSLPRDTDAAGIQASFHNGVLTVTVPRTASSQTARKVEVKAA